MRNIVVIAALVIAGCAAPQYMDQNGMPAPERVLHECDYETRTTVTMSARSRGMLRRGLEHEDLYRACLRARGYRKAP